MANNSNNIISPELKRWIGTEKDMGSETVEAGAIKKFADAIKDPNPLWRDQEYAKSSGYMSVIAPPTFIHCLRSIGYPNITPQPMPWKSTTSLNGGNEFEYFNPIRPGDVISGKAKLIDIFNRDTRQMGPMIFTVVEMTYTNQTGDLVAKQRSTGITYENKGS